MTGDGRTAIPVWTTNRGLLVMLRTALSQQGRDVAQAPGLAAFRHLLDESRPRVVIAAAEDVAAAGLDPVLLERLVGEATSVVLLSSARPLPEPPGPRTRVLPVPFTARDLADALATSLAIATPAWVPAGPPAESPAPIPPSAPPSPAVQPSTPPAASPAPSPEAVEALVLREVERAVRAAVEDAVRRVVPELAEAIIRAELERLLKESEEEALAGTPDDDER